MKPPVSVVMAVYNGQAYLREQLDSVLGQLQSGDELVVVDDASSDGSPGMLAALTDPRVRLIRHAVNLGVAGSFEAGLRAARHDIVFLCDQDDVWMPGKREAMVEAFIRNPACLVVVSDAELIDAQGRVSAPSFMRMRGGFHGGVWDTLWRNRYLGCAMAVRRPLLAAALPIPRGVPQHDMWLGGLAAALGPVCFVPQPLIQYRRHDKNVTPARRQSFVRMLRWRWALLRALTVRLVRLRFRSAAWVEPRRAD